MQQLTIRGFDPELARRIRDLAEREGISLNQAALRLLRRGAGLVRDKLGDDAAIGPRLDHVIGTWDDDDVRQLESAVQDFERIDDASWQRGGCSTPTCTPRSGVAAPRR